jgi:L-gulonolactone oxidase
MVSAAAAWTNWAGTASCAPARRLTVSSEEEIIRAVTDAANDGLTVKAVGAGHSFTDAACTDGVMLRLDGHDAVLEADPETGLVTVEAGISLAKLNDELAARGLAMENLGDIAYQSIAGAISTSTHGTGRAFGNLATQVRGVRLVAGDGSVVDCDAETLLAARVSVGALGVLSTVTLQTVPAFNLRAVEQPMRVDECLGKLDELVEANDHFEFYWFPHTERVQTLRNNRTDEPARPRGRVGRYVNDILLENHMLGLLCRLGRARPKLVPRLSGLIAAGWGSSERIDRSDLVFTSPRMVRFSEMEYAVPRELAVEAFNAVREEIDRRGLRVGFPVELRFSKGDDAFLSTAHGRDTAYVACHLFQGVPYDDFYRPIEPRMRELGGRPHWGKLHYRTADDLAPAYPEWDRFQAVRRRLDPDGRFRNAYTDRLFG